MRLSLSRKTISISLLTAFILLLLNYLFIQNAYYTIDLDSQSSGVTVGYINADGNQSEPRSIFGIYMVPRSADVIVAKGDNQETRELISDKPLIGIGNIRLALHPQKSVTKIGQGGLGCNGIMDTDRYFTYSCFDATNDLFAYADKSSGQYDNQPIEQSSADTRLSTTPYRSGLLSIVVSSGAPSVQYLDVRTGKVRILPLKGGIESVNLFTGSDGSFVVVNNPSHQLTFYSDIDDAPRVFDISKDVVYSYCDVTKKTLLCAATPAEVLAANEEGAHDAANLKLVKDSRILRYDMESNQRSDLPTERLVDRVCLANDGIYSLEDDGKLYYYFASSGYQSLIAAEVKSVSCATDSMVYTDGSSIFVTKEGSARLLFHEGHFSISTIQQLSGRTIFTTYIKDEPSSPLHTYKIADDNAVLPRIESILPYGLDDKLPILEMDYDDKNIYIKPEVSVTSDRAANRTIIDQEMLAKTKRSIEARLNADGLLDARSLVYYYN